MDPASETLLDGGVKSLKGGPLVPGNALQLPWTALVKQVPDKMKIASLGLDSSESVDF